MAIPNNHPFQINSTYESKQYIDTINNYLKSINLTVEINTIGFGRNNSLDSKLLLDIADNFDGTFSFISDTSMLSTNFLYVIANIVHQIPIKKLYFNVNGEIINISKFKFGETRDYCFNTNNIKLNIVYSNSDIEELIPNQVAITNFNQYNDIERLYFVDILKNIIDNPYNSKQILEKLKSYLESQPQTDTIKKYLSDILPSIESHNGGQINLALSRDDYYMDWGLHYLNSYYNAQKTKCRTNFKDCGLPYNTSNIDTSISKYEAVFLSLPPPKTSKQSHHSRTITNNNIFYNQSGGCFTGESIILCKNGFKYVKELKKGDIVSTPSGYTKILCVVENYNNNPIKLNTFYTKYGNIDITPYHPIYFNNEWIFPNQINNNIIFTNNKVYNLVLENYHMVYLGDIIACTLGHNINTNSIIKHSFLGTECVINNLKLSPTYDEGIVRLYPYNIIRDSNTNLITKYKF